MNDWLDLEHRLWRSLNEHRLVDKKIVVGFSGGIDSLALLKALSRTKKLNLAACFVHHGPGSHEPYRDEALKFCEAFCRQEGIPFHSRRNTQRELRSEQELREFRFAELRDVLAQTQSEVLGLAHHREDLLETRLLRLIRGTGPQGLVAMMEFDENVFRPFLKISKKDLSQYLDHFSLKAHEDPSNQQVEPFRNWLRQEWLPALEARQTGSVQSLARSLELLTESAQESGDFKNYFNQNQLSRSLYLGLSKAEQKQLLAQWLHQLQIKDFSQAHVDEVRKRLDNSQKEFTFRVAGLNWFVNAQQIRVQE